MTSSEIDSEHYTALDWIGWNADREFALEVQAGWDELILAGQKKIETRAYPLPGPLLHKKIYILQAKPGSAVSALPNRVDLDDASSLKITGWFVIESIKEYTNYQEFENDERLHFVTSDSAFGWKKGETNRIYGWVISKYGTDSPVAHPSEAFRRMRSIFELRYSGLKNCIACSSLDTSHLLAEEDISNKLGSSLFLWTLEKSERGLFLSRKYTAKTFQAALESINDMGIIAERESHHPDFHLTNYREVEIVIYTHKLNGITENDLVLAEMFDAEVKVSYSPKWLKQHPEAEYTSKG